MSNWIDIEDRLPNKDGQYLVYCPTAIPSKLLVTVAWYDPGFGWSNLPGVWIETIEYWMPMPAPPEIKDNH